jgi:hypothetical protein
VKCIKCGVDTHEPALHWAFESMDPVLTSPANRVVIGALWREAKRRGVEDVFLEVYMRKRADWLLWNIRVQRDWQTKVSRRPARGRHHDSWRIRESYVGRAA